MWRPRLPSTGFSHRCFGFIFFWSSLTSKKQGPRGGWLRGSCHYYPTGYNFCRIMHCNRKADRYTGVNQSTNEIISQLTGDWASYPRVSCGPWIWTIGPQRWDRAITRGYHAPTNTISSQLAQFNLYLIHWHLPSVTGTRSLQITPFCTTSSVYC